MFNPKISLRFVKGFDFADVLFSDPCEELRVYYSGKEVVFNSKPTHSMIKDMIDIKLDEKMGVDEYIASLKEQKKNEQKKNITSDQLNLEVVEEESNERKVKKIVPKRVIRKYKVRQF